MPTPVTCKRSVRSNLTDDRLLEIALLALASIKDCCGAGTSPSAPHENNCAVATANHWLEYHAGILSKRPDGADELLAVLEGHMVGHDQFHEIRDAVKKFKQRTGRS